MEPTRKEIIHINTYTNHESFPENFAFEVHYAYVFEHEGKTLKKMYFAQLNTDNTDDYILWENLTEEIIWTWIPSEELANTKASAMQHADNHFFPSHTTYSEFPWGSE